MTDTSRYWNFATAAAISIGILNITPTYCRLLFSSDMFMNFELLWKITTNFLVLMLIGKKMVCTLIKPSEEFTYGQSFKWCYLSCLLSSLVEGLLYAFYVKVLDPTYLDSIHDAVMKVLADSPQYSSQIGEVEKTLASLLTPSGIIMSTILSAVVCGAVMSLIAAASVKKNIDYSIDDE